MRQSPKPGELLLGAARIRAEDTEDEASRAGSHQIADDLEAQARRSVPDRLSHIGPGGELVPLAADGEPTAEFRRTLEKPDLVSAVASRNRLDLLQSAGVLESGLDLADTALAQNSLEQMLTHQLAAVHHAAMKMTKQMNRQIENLSILQDDRRACANFEATRLAGAASRLMMAFQQGALALQRLKTGGRQVVTVQHVTVGPGGQAIVAAEVTSGERARMRHRGRATNRG